MIKAAPTHLLIITRILAEYAEGIEARAFGSRVNGTPKDYSDLDVALVGDTKLEYTILARIKEAFEESDLPFRVDILDWHAISEEFQNVILRNYEVLQSADTKKKSKPSSDRF